MNKNTFSAVSIFLVSSIFSSTKILAQAPKDSLRYILEHEKDLAKEEAGTHNGGGLTIGHNFFSKAPNSKIVFRKRVLRPGSSIGYHLQAEEEIYYIVQGNGEMQMNGKTFPVKGGDAILTLPGSSHGLRPVGGDSLTVIINYLKK